MLRPPSTPPDGSQLTEVFLGKRYPVSVITRHSPAVRTKTVFNYMGHLVSKSKGIFGRSFVPQGWRSKGGSLAERRVLPGVES